VKKLLRKEEKNPYTGNGRLSPIEGRKGNLREGGPTRDGGGLKEGREFDI